MPPIKGRMLGRMGMIASMQQNTKQLRNVYKTTVARRKFKSSPVKSSSLPDNITEDSKLMAMRMPEDIVRILPSVKKYKGSKDFVDLTDDISCHSGDTSNSIKSEPEIDSAYNVTSPGNIVGLTHRGRGLNKYAMKQISEERFMGIIFDVGVSPTGDIFVSCCEGIFICDSSLDRKSKLGQVVLPGGVAFFSDGRVVVICRNQDTVNFFSHDGVFIKAFKGGFSPMGLVINSRDELIVSDPGKKCVHVFNTMGEELHTIPTNGRGYAFRWPLYMSPSNTEEEELLVCDCHAQTVVKFNGAHNYAYTYKLKTLCGNEVLRPHGIATNHEGDLFVVDTTMETVEVFSEDDTYVQTLISSEDGCPIKPKCLAISRDGLFVIGGRLGKVRVYQFLDDDELGMNRELRTPMKHEIKTPIKREPEDITPMSTSASKSRRVSDDTPSKREIRAARRNVFKTEDTPTTPEVEPNPEIEENEKGENDDVIELNSNNSNADVIVLE